MQSTPEKIKRVALRLLERSGAKGVSMRKVAQTIGVTPMALYHHFKNREALLEAVVSEEFAQLEREFAQTELQGRGEDRLVQILLVYVNYALARPRVFDYLFAERRAGARQYPRDFRAGRSPTINRIAEIIRAGMAKGEFKSGDEWEISMIFWAHVHGFVMLYRADRFDLSEKQFRALVTTSIRGLMHGLAK